MFLTQSAKEEILEYWEGRKAARRTGNDDGGMGFTDSNIIALCDTINRYPDWCTLQSCAGHPPNAKGYAAKGNLWLWFSERMAANLISRCDALSQRPGIEQVAILFGRGRNQAIVDITFAGDDSGKLAESSSEILDWLQESA